MMAIRERTTRTILLAIAVVLCTAVFSALLAEPVQATRLPTELREAAISVFPHATVRLDGSLALPDGSLILPLVPHIADAKKTKYDVEAKFPEQNPVIVFYANGWGHVRTVHSGKSRTIALPKDTPEKLLKRALAMHFPSDLIVPEHFVLPKSLKPFVGDLQIATVEDVAMIKPDFAHIKKDTAPAQYTGHGTVVLTSINTGTITLLDGKTLQKLVEFPTEGTPCSMHYLNGVIYIADQGKHRVLMLDPSKRRFLGQIDLAAGSAPRGITALPNGKLLYISESGPGNVAVIETATGKVLVRTKVSPGPGRMAVTTDGVFLLVLNVSSGDMTVIATYNQKVVGTVKVGAMPTAIALGPDGRTAYVSSKNTNTVAIVDITSRRVTSTIKTGASPTGIALSSDGTHLFVANARDNNITIYDTKTLALVGEAKLPLDVEFPGTICLLPGGKKLVVTSQQTDAIGVMDTEKRTFEGETRLGHPVQEVMWAPVH